MTKSSHVQVTVASKPAPRRSHKVLAVYLVMYAWVKNLDCVIIDGDHLRKYLGGLSRLEKSRQKQIIEDTKPFFVFAQYLGSGDGGSPTLFLSRLRMPDSTWQSSTSLDGYQKRLAAVGVRAGQVRLPTEEAIVALNATVIHGIADFAPLVLPFDWSVDFED